MAFDLSSYGSALAIINQFVDDRAVKVFEISPMGTAAQVILMGEEIRSLEFIENEARSLFRSQILNSAVIADMHTDLLPIYLSQKSAPLAKCMAVLEGESVAIGLQLAQQYLKNSIQLTDFRVVRTHPKNVIITLTSDAVSKLSEIETANFRRTCIEDLQPPLREIFEIIQPPEAVKN